MWSIVLVILWFLYLIYFYLNFILNRKGELIGCNSYFNKHLLKPNSFLNRVYIKKNSLECPHIRVYALLFVTNFVELIGLVVLSICVIIMIYQSVMIYMMVGSIISFIILNIIVIRMENMIRQRYFFYEYRLTMEECRNISKELSLKYPSFNNR